MLAGCFNQKQGLSCFINPARCNWHYYPNQCQVEQRPAITFSEAFVWQVRYKADPDQTIGQTDQTDSTYQIDPS
jgi:hypothetical protein